MACVWGIQDATALFFDYVTLQGLFHVPEVHILVPKPGNVSAVTHSSQTQAEHVQSDPGIKFAMRPF